MLLDDQRFVFVRGGVGDRREPAAPTGGSAAAATAVTGGGCRRGTAATIRAATGRRWLGGRRLPQCKLEAELRDAHVCGGDAVDGEGGVMWAH